MAHFFNYSQKTIIMSDNLNDRGARDRARISLSEDWEVKYWTKTLACSSDELQRAVAKVGHSVEKVRQELKR